MKNLINLVKTLFIKIKKMNVFFFFIYLYKIKSNLNITLKIIFIISLVNFNELTSIWDLGDLALKMVEQESKNTKIEDTAETVVQITEIQKDPLKAVEIDFDAMEFGEWLDYLRENEPKAYWFFVISFCATSVFCIWLMHYIIGPGFPPREPH